MEKVILIRRSSPDCYDEFSNYYKDRWSYCRMKCLWDATFNISFKDYREKVHEIQKENLEDIVAQSNCSVMYLYELDNIEQLAGKLVLPVDDDDWFVDNIFDEIQEFENQTYRWNYLRLNHVCVEKFGYSNVKFNSIDFNRYFYLSNNYAIHSPNNLENLVSHIKMNRFYLSAASSEIYIDKYLSLYNYHLGSLSFLCDMVINNGKMIYQLIDQFLSRLDIDKKCPVYFYKFIFKMHEIYKQMRIVKMY